MHVYGDPEKLPRHQRFTREKAHLHDFLGCLCWGSVYLDVRGH